MSHKIVETEVDQPDIVIRPEVGVFAINEFELRNQILAAGEAAALAVLLAIQQADRGKNPD